MGGGDNDLSGREIVPVHAELLPTTLRSFLAVPIFHRYR